jgi:GNAT superfamily N-acetyltransferase
MHPMTRAKADQFWRSVADSSLRGERVLLTAETPAGVLIGTVQVVFAPMDNQPHRADVAKMLVHRDHRRGGVGAALLAAAEEQAIQCRRTLLVLDTVTGADGERLYAQHGWQRCGVIPNYALWPDGRPCSTTVFYKELR